MDSSETVSLKCLETPVFLAHGKADEKIKSTFGENVRMALEALGMDVEWKLYPELGHWYKEPDEIDDILAFLNSKANV